MDSTERTNQMLPISCESDNRGRSRTTNLYNIQRTAYDNHGKHHVPTLMDLCMAQRRSLSSQILPALPRAGRVGTTHCPALPRAT